MLAMVIYCMIAVKPQRRLVKKHQWVTQLVVLFSSDWTSTLFRHSLYNLTVTL